MAELSGLTSLTVLFLTANQISDISALVANTRLGSGDRVNLLIHVYGAGAGRLQGRLKREGLSAEATIDRILEVVDAFKGEAPQSDDMTCVVVRVEDAESTGT